MVSSVRLEIVFLLREIFSNLYGKFCEIRDCLLVLSNLLLQLSDHIVELGSLPDQMIDLAADIGVLCEGGVEVDHDPVQPVLQQQDLLAQVLLLLASLSNMRQ
jgi:hypothetical protein